MSKKYKHYEWVKDPFFHLIVTDEVKLNKGDYYIIMYKTVFIVDSVKYSEAHLQLFLTDLPVYIEMLEKGGAYVKRGYYTFTCSKKAYENNVDKIVDMLQSKDVTAIEIERGLKMIMLKASRLLKAIETSMGIPFNNFRCVFFNLPFNESTFYRSAFSIYLNFKFRLPGTMTNIKKLDWSTFKMTDNKVLPKNPQCELYTPSSVGISTITI